MELKYSKVNKEFINNSVGAVLLETELLDELSKTNIEEFKLILGSETDLKNLNTGVS